MKLFGIFKSNSNELTSKDIENLKKETDFNQKEIKKSHKKFNALDKDKKGFVSINDLVSIPEVENNPLRYHIAQYLNNNHENEEISFDSFIQFIDMFKNNKVEDQYKFLFGLFDFDKDGKISDMDMLINFKLLLGNSLTEEQIKDIVDKTINEYSDKKGYIDYNDFVKILNDA